VRLRVLIIGAGAVGSLIGARLALAGHDVTLVGRAALRDAVAADGLTLVTPDGLRQTVRPQVATAAADALADPAHFDLACLTVKAYDTAAVIDELGPAAGALPPLISFQNGLGNEEALAAAFGADRVIAGALDTPVSVPAAGQVQVHRPRYRMGLAPVGAAGVGEAATALAQAGFDVRTHADHRSLKWSKLILNLPANASCAILDWTPAQVMAHPLTARLEARAWQEALNVMAALGVRPVNLAGYPLAVFAPVARRLPPGVLGRVLRGLVSGGRGSKMPSLHMALAEGKRSEVAWLNGAVAQLGAAHDVATPVNQALADIVAALTEERERRADWRGNIARLDRWSAGERV
jgi:2-dehydropantoate 2-reductase